MSSNVNSYASLTEFKGVLGVTSTTDDVAMRKALESASRSIENFCKRHFYSLSATKTYDGADILFIDDLLSVTTFKLDEDMDGVYEKTIDTSDYILYPLNNYPKMWIEISDNGDYGSFASYVKNGVQIVGTWGFGDGTSSTPYVTDTTTSEAIDIGETAIDVTSASNLSAGMTILVESEQMYITSITSNTLTVEKGVNGTTDSAHLTGKQVYYYRYPRDVMQTCLDLASALWETRDKRGLASYSIGDFSCTLSKSAINDILSNSLTSYKKIHI